MTTYISMLRGINVSGKNMIKMDVLSKLYTSLGFTDVQTYIQSGNVLFKSPNADASALEKQIHEKIKKELGLDIPVIIRTKDELEKIIKKNPFKNKEEGRLYVTFLSDEPKDKGVEEIEKAKEKSEAFVVSGKEVYLFCPNGYGKTKLSNTLFERKLNVNATTRNWNTVNALFAMAK